MKRSIACSIALTLTMVSTSAAQTPEKGAWELGGFGRYAPMFSSDVLNLTPGWGAGGRIGYFFRQNWAVEGELGFTREFRYTTKGNVDATPYKLRLAYHLPMTDATRFIVGAGYTGNHWSVQDFDSRSSNQFGGVVGWQWAMSELFALRLQASWDRFAATQSYAKDEKGNIGAFEFGLTWPGGGPRDSDHDGVLNKVDECPNTPVGDAIDARGCSLPKDGDNDGIVDPNDACPATPMGDKVDARGCSLPKDADNDGIIDANDRCANTPAGTPVTANGCPRDTDNDGVLDNADRCANTPAGTKVDANGCPLPPPDADADGVPDANDRCANTPIGTRVDARGCQMLFETGKTALVLQGVTFATGSANLTEGSLPVLDRVAESLVANAEVKLEVQGHTDNTGSLAGNRRISQRRAEAVRAYLISKGVDAARLTAKGYGPDQPTAPNTTVDGRAMNRRVELKQIP